MLSKLNKLKNVNQTVSKVNNVQSMVLVPLNAETKRFFQSYSKAKHPGFLDSISGVYEDTRQGLFLKPDPFRDDNFHPYSHHLGAKVLYVILIIPSFNFFKLKF
jgi:hypothetical protein